MAGDFSITPALAVSTVQPQRNEAGQAAGFSQTQQQASPATALTTQSPPPVNPGLHLDPALNLVVLQFFDAKGDVTQSIPSQKQLAAYRQDSAAESSTHASEAAPRLF